MMSEPISRQEIAILKQEADRARDDFARRLNEMDSQGSRGVVELRVQMADQLTATTALAKSVKSVRREMRREFAAHLKVHADDERKRVTSRRWLIGSIIAGVAAIDGPLVTILLSRH